MNLAQLAFVGRLDPFDDNRQRHARAAAAGDEVRVARGVYASAGVWAAASEQSRHALRARAIAETRGFKGAVLSHWSAAAVHGLPLAGSWPQQVHLTVGRTQGGRSKAAVVKHALALQPEDHVSIDGLLVTSLARTVLDIASVATFEQSVIMADAALLVPRTRGASGKTTPDELMLAWERALPFRAHKRTRRVIDFSDAGAESPIESRSRVTMARIGCPAPRLQTAFFDRDGFIGRVDFDWPEQGVVGEADGDLKYLDEQYRSGRTPGQVHLDEKKREDRIRALPRGFARWGWAEAGDEVALRRRLTDAGLRW